MRGKLFLTIMIILVSFSGMLGRAGGGVREASPPGTDRGVPLEEETGPPGEGETYPPGEGETGPPWEGEAELSDDGKPESALESEGGSASCQAGPELSGNGTPEGESEAVDISWFDRAVFVGDSVSLRLQMYCNSTDALGGAQFLCSGSLSAHNALWEVSPESVHPSYKGTKMTVEEGVAQSGAENVYIMLGMNDIAEGLGESAECMETLVGRIKEKSPEANIIIQSVTPMMPTSTIWSEKLNNGTISQYNEILSGLCGENGWDYLPVDEIFKDSEGNLKAKYCSDNPGMAIHFTPEASKAWVEYLFTHVPDHIK